MAENVEREQAGREVRDELKERILREQALVNERETRPEEAGGMPFHPVESAPDATPAEKKQQTPVEEIKPSATKRDIQSEGT